MKFHRSPPSRRSVIAGLASTLAAPSLLRAQGAAYPARPVTLIVPFAPGGSTDVIARVVAEAMRGPLGQPVVVENHAGAGGSLGTGQIARASADGYTIGMGTASTLAINPAAYRSLPYDVARDLSPIGLIAEVPNIMTINASLPAPGMAAFIALAKGRPGQLSYGSSGNGSVSHLMGEQFKLSTGTDILHVPYRGVGPALQDVVGGQIQVMFDNLPTSLPLVQGGRLRALAVSSRQRLAVLPDIPTFAELNLSELDWTAFFGLVAPAKTDPAILAALNGALTRALDDAGVREKLAAQQASVAPGAPAQFGTMIAEAGARMRRATQAANISIE
jgi:tripartite-type tricarboxylate transporter receptor subunit TctC